MRLKLYRAPAMAEAMRQLRADLGGDALILSTRRVGDGVEITAGLEQEAPVPPPLPNPASSPAAIADLRQQKLVPEPRQQALAPDLRQQALAPDLRQLALAPDLRQQALAWHGVPAALARRLQAGPLAFALSACLRFEKLAWPNDAAPLLLAGPPGAGKTLTTARLATRLVVAGASPLVITADGQRAGATEQLAAFTRLLGVKLLVASTPENLARALSRRKDGGPVLIDAPGTDPFDTAGMAALAGLAKVAGARIALVLPAGLDPDEAGEIAQAHAVAGASLLIATRLDVARRLGSVAAAAQAGLALAEAGIGPGAADGLAPLSPEMLAHRLQQFPGLRA